MKKYNCLLFNNEIWLLELRIKHDLEVFDYVVICEGDKTYSGMEKPYYFERYKHLFEKYLDRIIYFKVQLPKATRGDFRSTVSTGKSIFVKTNRWEVEHYHRSIFKEHILNITQPDDLIRFSDLDEIQNNNEINEHKCADDITFYPYHNYSNFISEKPHEKTWIAPFVASARILDKIQPGDYRKIGGKMSKYIVHHICNERYLRHNDPMETPIYNKYELPIQDVKFPDRHWGIHLTAVTKHLNSRDKAHSFSHAEIDTTLIAMHGRSPNPAEVEKNTENMISKYINTELMIKPHKYIPTKLFSDTIFGGLYM